MCRRPPAAAPQLVTVTDPGGRLSCATTVATNAPSPAGTLASRPMSTIDAVTKYTVTGCGGGEAVAGGDNGGGTDNAQQQHIVPFGSRTFVFPTTHAMVHTGGRGGG